MAVPPLTQLTSSVLEEQGFDVEKYVTKNNLPDRLIPAHPTFKMCITNTWQIHVTYNGQFKVKVFENHDEIKSYVIRIKSEEALMIFVEDYINIYVIEEFVVEYNDNMTLLGGRDIDLNNMTNEEKVGLAKKYITFIHDTVIEDIEEVQKEDE